MGFWAPSLAYQRSSQHGTSDATSASTAVAADASTNTKGSWVELVASSGFDAGAFVLWIQDVTNNSDFLIDVGVGAGGSETVIVENFLYTNGVGSPNLSVLFPIAIPVGTRIAVRCQSSDSSAQIGVAVRLMAGDWASWRRSFERCTTYGANTADSGGVSVDPGASTNTEGSWTEITSATTAPISYLIAVAGNQNNGARTLGNWLVDVAVGAGGSETVVIENIPIRITGQTDFVEPSVWAEFPVDIPTGTRIAIRTQCSINDATDRLIDFALYGFD